MKKRSKVSNTARVYCDGLTSKGRSIILIILSFCFYSCDLCDASLIWFPAIEEEHMMCTSRERAEKQEEPSKLCKHCDC